MFIGTFTPALTDEVKEPLFLSRLISCSGLPWSGEKYLENEIFSRSGKSRGILLMAREI